jgi:hypothetical protein
VLKKTAAKCFASVGAGIGQAAQYILERIDGIVPPEYRGQSEFLRGGREFIGYFDTLTCAEKDNLPEYEEDIINELREGEIRKKMHLKYCVGNVINLGAGTALTYLLGHPIPFAIGLVFSGVQDVLNMPVRGFCKIMKEGLASNNYRGAELFGKLELASRRLANLTIAVQNFLINPGWLFGDHTEVNALRQEIRSTFSRESYKVELDSKETKNLSASLKSELNQIYRTFREHWRKKPESVHVSYKQRYDYILSKLAGELDDAEELDL